MHLTGRLALLSGALLLAGARSAASQTGADSIAIATRVEIPPQLDGHDQDPAWQVAAPIRTFRMFAPIEDADPTIRTEARIVYDDRALYILVRAFDSRPESIVRLLARRDTDGPPNDQVLIFLDPYHDRRSGYTFIVTAAGVKSDYLLYDDVGSDHSWDGIWDAATGVDSLGWVAEIAIPFHQLRFADHLAPEFGIMIGRWVGRTDERMSWPLYRRSRAGLVSQLGTLRGLERVGATAGVELAPYGLLERGDPVLPEFRGTSRSRVSAGGDVKWNPRSNLSLVGTVNPDFGQVEADPAVLNLTGVEVFQQERRPFFLEGGGLLSFPLWNDGVSQLFYSRRIGRAPALLSERGGLDSPAFTGILGAAKVNARLAAHTSAGLVSAATREEHGRTLPGGSAAVIEPFTMYGAGRILQEFREGRSGFSVMGTSVERSLDDSAIRNRVPRTARVIAVSGQHQSGSGAFRLSMWAGASRVGGATGAISALQLSPVHVFQRPDGPVRYDSTRGALAGTAFSVGLEKVGGGITRFALMYRRISSGFEVNDLGFLTKSGVQTWYSSGELNFSQAGGLLGVPFRRASLTLELGGEWGTDGLPLTRGLNLGGMWQTPGQSELRASVDQQFPGAYCTVACTRGGPSVYNPPRTTLSLDFRGTPRHALVPHALVEGFVDDGRRSHGHKQQVDLTWRARSNLNLSGSGYWSDVRYAWFFYHRFGDPLSDTTHYAVGGLDLDTRTITARADYTITRTLTLQAYGQAFVSRGEWSDIRELGDAKSRDPARAFTSYSDSSITAHPGGIDNKQFRANLVLRWEYRTGSTLFLVWSQDREFNGNTPGRLGLWPGRDLGELFQHPAVNTVAVKASFWFRP